MMHKFLASLLVLGPGAVAATAHAETIVDLSGDYNGGEASSGFGNQMVRKGTADLDGDGDADDTWLRVPYQPVASHLKHWSPPAGKTTNFNAGYVTHSFDTPQSRVSAAEVRYHPNDYLQCIKAAGTAQRDMSAAFLIAVEADDFLVPLPAGTPLTRMSIDLNRSPSLLGAKTRFAVRTAGQWYVTQDAMTNLSGPRDLDPASAKWLPLDDAAKNFYYLSSPDAERAVDFSSLSAVEAVGVLIQKEHFDGTSVRDNLNFLLRDLKVESGTSDATDTVAAQPAGLQFNPLFTDHMVLQRDRGIPVWGTAGDGGGVTIRLGDQTVTGLADPDGRWRVKLPPQSASAKPQTLSVTGDGQTIQLNDVLVGDVWLCAGQSNMARTLGNFVTLRATADSMNQPLIRLMKTRERGVASDTPEAAVQMDPAFADSWQVCTPKHARQFSATGMVFGLQLQQNIGIPIGLLYANRGGTPINSWLPAEVMRGNPIYDRYFDPNQNKYLTQAGGVNAPSRLYNGSIAPLIPFAIRGVIWYQGEADVTVADQYTEMFSDLIGAWRQRWNQPLPFLFVQLASYGNRGGDPSGQSWARLRQAQAGVLDLPHTQMVVGIDAGEFDDIHPQDKSTIGRRLALCAQKLNDPSIVASGPMFAGMSIEGRVATLSFDSIADGLQIRRVAMNRTRDLPVGEDPDALVAEADQLLGFSICGSDQIFHPAAARLLGTDQVMVAAREVEHPIAVRYGWADFALCNLYNSAGLPAAPFRTDNFSVTK